MESEPQLILEIKPTNWYGEEFHLKKEKFDSSIFLARIREILAS